MAPKESRAGSLVEYHDGKFWFHKKSETLTVGITSLAMDDLGEAEGIELPSEGDDIDKDDIICSIDGSDGAVKVFSPAAGIITEINDALVSDVQILNEDPIDEGWLVKIEIQDDSDLKEYL